jgi:hypothetical protein
MDVDPIEVQRHLGGVDYPARGEELVSTAESRGAPSAVVEALSGLGDREFDGPDEVMEALGRRP